MTRSSELDGFRRRKHTTGSSIGPWTTPLQGFFVATTGSNGNAGTEASPWQTIKFALTQATAGSTIWVRGGTHSSNCHQAGVTAWNTGSSFSNAITIQAYPGETVNISSQVGYQPPVNPTNFYHIWKDIRFVAATNGCIYGTDGVNFVRFQNCEITNGGSAGQGVLIASADCSGWEFLTVESHHNGSTTNLDHGMYLGGTNHIVDGCHLHDNFAYGVQFYPTGSGHILRNTRIHANFYGFIFYNGSNNTAYNNLVYANSSDGLGANLQTNLTLYHNVSYNNGNDGIIVVGSSGTIIKNNISYLNAATAINASGATSTNNVTTNPSFNAPGSGDFTLTSSSTNCHDAGATGTGVTTDFAGRTRNSPPDIGAYEYP